MTISTHVLDAAAGQPATGVSVTLSRRQADAEGAAPGDCWLEVESGRTDADGRYRFATDASPGEYRLIFATGAYFAARSAPTFYPEVAVTFTVAGGDGDGDGDENGAHFHVPLLLSPYAYSTYRGS